MSEPEKEGVEARLLPPPEGVKERMDTLMAVASGKVDPAWLEQAFDYAVMVADRGLPFSCNDIWEAGLEEPPSPHGRALGSQVSKLARGGYIKYTGTMIRSKRGVAHIPVWIKV